MHMMLRMTKVETSILHLIETPLLLVRGGRVTLANASALLLLGDHSVGQDVRLTIRNPDALDLIASPSGGRIAIPDISVPGSNWDLVCKILDDGTRLITLHDLSAQDSISRSHTDFVANASHELRTPLAAVMGYVETLLEPKVGDDPPTRIRFLEIVRRESVRMQSLLDDLMSLSRIEAGRHEAPAEPVNLAAIARDVASEFDNAARIEASLPDQASVSGDRAQLAQVLRNLIDNAHKYGRPDRPIRVRIAIGGNGWVNLVVQNDGEAIAPEHLPRLTERFYRADPGRSRAVGGTGLGLSIVKHIIVRHRGRLDITSTPGEGTIATIALPPPR